MSDPRYTLSSRQKKDMVDGVIRVAIPIPRDWPDELWAAPDGLQDLVDFAASSLGVLGEQIAEVGIRRIFVSPGRVAPGLTGLVGRVVQDYDSADLWGSWHIVVVATLRGAAPIRPKPGPIQWPLGVLHGDWRYPPAAE